MSEKVAWEREKMEMTKYSKVDSKIININVGGTHSMTTSTDVLCSVPGSKLS